MAEEEKQRGGGASARRELETLILGKVAEVSSAIDAARHVDEVVCALHSLAVRLFPVNSSLVSGVVDRRYRNQIVDVMLLNNAERNSWKQVFYDGAAFPTMANILIHNVALNWLACFPLTARKQVYDPFFVEGPSAEIVQALVPALKRNGSKEDVDHNAICLNIERLLVLCLLENKGVQHMVGEFEVPYRNSEHADVLLKPVVVKFIPRVAQLLTSIPDKAKLEASSALSSHLFFQQISVQLFVGAEERALELFDKMDTSDRNIPDGTFLFVGEMISRICRRGSAGILVAEMIPRILNHVRSFLSTVDSVAPITIESIPESLFWSNIVEAIKDQYAIERLSEELLRSLGTQDVSDLEAYWMLWLLFHRSFIRKAAMRAMYVDKFLFWKVFPVRCLKWILQFSVFECPPNAGTLDGQKTKHFLDTVQRLVSVWSRREFIRSSPMEQQAYVTAAVGLCVEKMSREELETTKDVLHSILQGVSCRLESPIDLVRKMASSIALVFSKAVDPSNPLHLDDDCCDTVDWNFGIIPQRKEIVAASHPNGASHAESKISFCKEKKSSGDDKRQKNVKGKIIHTETVLSDLRLVDPDEVIDPAMLNSEPPCDEEDDDESKNSETSSDSSLQPYDLSDDDTDLQKNFSQLGDIAAALRKRDDPDGVERALDIAERLVKASPDELRHNAGDLVRALVHVRCSDVTIEGQEDSAEAKRQKALVALLVTSPFESLDVLTKLLYSSSVDVSQRILIIDVMTEAAQELADAKTLRTEHQQSNLISTISESQPWFLPNSKGPSGAGSWKEVAEPGTFLSWSHCYERELPSRPGQIKPGKSRIWSLGKAKNPQLEWSKNRFPLYAATFMLPAMHGFDKRRHGVDLLHRDFIVLGKLIYMLGVCMKCMAMHPEASALAPALLDMIRSREVSQHPEAYVRRSVLFAASCVLAALHPSYVASALIEGNQEFSHGLEWIRTWALHIAEADPDTECSSMAMGCLQLHAEMALQTSRALDSADCFKAKTHTLPAKLDDIIIPFSSNGI